MKQPLFFAITIPIFLLISACAPGAKSPGLPYTITLTPEAVVSSEPPVTPEMLLATEPATETLAAVSLTPSEPPETSSATPTSNPPTNTPYVPAPTETLLPPLELPTERPLAPALVPWTGLPTYPGDSDPGLLFRVEYDPDTWAQTDGNFGAIVLANRQIEYCTITPWSGRGLPVEWKVAHDFRIIGSASFDVSTVTEQGVVKFVSYVGGDQHVLTGFQVSFNDQQSNCLQEAEKIFGTLRSYAAIPTITPTSLPETTTPSP